MGVACFFMCTDLTGVGDGWDGGGLGLRNARPHGNHTGMNAFLLRLICLAFVFTKWQIQAKDWIEHWGGDLFPVVSTNSNE